ncbi:MAG: Holliday junction branch migration protein RuvA [Solobacterium sp.]|nr:Holliday junction branch migration protein RuvA [Erysipelotrichaceae bacterium]MBQ1447528.1 Holliday junction branch migration protein RuvA [Solobacterium sp.]MBR2727437.1 Holliday junction branch migration protein RuvA [Solobacterium sp.]
MIAFVQGKVVSYDADHIVVENQGIGWDIAWPHADRIHLNEEVRIYTYMHISENDIGLYGFESSEEKNLFLKLISVKGLGPKTAMNMLAVASTDRLINAVEQGDVAMLKRLPGIGAKTAGQIILDLKGRLVQTDSKAETYAQPVQEALEALKNLGYKQGELQIAGKYMSEKPGLSTEEYLKIGLQALVKAKLGG